MPTRSKFTAARRQRVLQVVKAGGSRRQAAKAAGISHGTLWSWLERGKAGAPDGRWRSFFEAVRTAELGSPELVAVETEFESMLQSPAAVLAWLEEEMGRDEPETTTTAVEVRVSFSPLVAGPTIDPTKGAQS